MQFKGRSLYNLLRISLEEKDSLQKYQPWQVLDYRALSEKELFQGLFDLGVSLSKEAFFLYAENVESPEDLVECLWVQESDWEGEEKCYLLVFELWRRLLPKRQSLSVFCDELDHCIGEFDQGHEIEEGVQRLLDQLEDILHRSVDLEMDPKDAFLAVSEYFAHDLEAFLYDYIVELLERGCDGASACLIEAFEEYVQKEKWFYFLKARLFCISGMQEWTSIIHRLLEEDLDKDLVQEIGSFLLIKEEAPLFFQCMDKAVSLVTDAEDLEEVVFMLSEFYSKKGETELAHQISKMQDILQLREHLSIQSFL